MMKRKHVTHVPVFLFLILFTVFFFQFQLLEVQRISSTVLDKKALIELQTYIGDTKTNLTIKNDNDDDISIHIHRKEKTGHRIATAKHHFMNKERKKELKQKHTSLVPNNTRFTPHILHLVEYFQNKMPASYMPNCGFDITISVADSTAPSAEPNITVEKDEKDWLKPWRRQYLAAFKDRLFYPGNKKYFLPSGTLNLTISYGDKMETDQNCAFANSAWKGEKTVYNPQDVLKWARNFVHPDALPWSERKKIPVWRGTGWGSPYPWRQVENVIQKYNETNLTQHEISEKAFEMILDTSTYGGEHSGRHRRNHLVYFSKQHPDLVDARLGSSRSIEEKHWQQNVTNGLQNLLPLHKIPKDQYYTEYQTHIIMGGIGAAFRTATTLRQGIAVILQDFPYEEWFVHEMKPYVNFIPIKEDLSDLKETLEWVRNNPQKVSEIAKKGKEFYDEYLSYDAMGEFYHELILRLMLCCSHES